MIGSTIRELRNRDGITQRELAQAMNVSTSTVAMWETNKREPDFETIKELSGLFKVDANRLLGISVESETKKEPTQRERLTDRIMALSDEGQAKVLDYISLLEK